MACGGSVSSSTLPGHGHAIRCEKGMPDCVRRAETLCKDQGYTIVGGRELTRLLGGSTSSYRKLATEGELQVYCGEYAPPTCLPAQQSEEAVYQLGEAPEGSPSDAPSAVPIVPVPGPTASAPAHVCVPGATQHCVGPGACNGGQICNADGLSFGSCDCGPSNAVPLSSHPTPESAPAASSPPGTMGTNAN
jgi:hypothetical protein